MQKPIDDLSNQGMNSVLNYFLRECKHFNRTGNSMKKLATHVRMHIRDRIFGCHLEGCNYCKQYFFLLFHGNEIYSLKWFLRNLWMNICIKNIIHWEAWKNFSNPMIRIKRVIGLNVKDEWKWTQLRQPLTISFLKSKRK